MARALADRALHLLDLPAPEYAHHALLADADGKRLAKRDKAKTIAALREEGYAPAEVRKMAQG